MLEDVTVGSMLYVAHPEKDGGLSLRKVWLTHVTEHAVRYCYANSPSAIGWQSVKDKQCAKSPRGAILNLIASAEDRRLLLLEDIAVADAHLAALRKHLEAFDVEAHIE